MLRFKNSTTVRLQHGDLTVDPLILTAMVEIATIYQELEGKDHFVTAVFDGDHVQNSKHYKGKAYDGRTKNLSNPFLAVDIIRKRLNEKYPGIFRVLYESHGKPNAHIHVQLNG